MNIGKSKPYAILVFGAPMSGKSFLAEHLSHAINAPFLNLTYLMREYRMTKKLAEELINQRIMIANQNKSMEQRERHHRALMSKLDEIQATNEERNCYLQMIEANTAVDSFFAHASYLRN